MSMNDTMNVQLRMQNMNSGPRRSQYQQQPPIRPTSVCSQAAYSTSRSQQQPKQYHCERSSSVGVPNYQPQVSYYYVMD